MHGAGMGRGGSIIPERKISKGGLSGKKKKK